MIEAVYLILIVLIFVIGFRKVDEAIQEDIYWSQKYSTDKYRSTISSEQLHFEQAIAIKHGRNYVYAQYGYEDRPSFHQFCEEWELPILQEHLAKWEEENGPVEETYHDKYMPYGVDWTDDIKKEIKENERRKRNGYCEFSQHSMCNDDDSD